jgi:tetratricopeptide (TPR) repeat protein
MRPKIAVVACLLALPVVRLDAQRIKLPVKMSELEKIVVKDSLDPAAHYNVALGYWNEKKWDNVERELRAALALQPRMAEALLALAYLPFGRSSRLWDDIGEKPMKPDVRKTLDASDADERRAYIVDPLVNQAIIGATMPSKSAFWDYDPEYYDTFYRAYEDINTGNYSQAYFEFSQMIRLYETEISRDPNQLPGSWVWGRGISAAHIGKTLEAVRDLTNLMNRSMEVQKADTVDLLPFVTNDYRYLIAATWQHGDSIGQAMALYKQVIDTDVGYYMAYVKLADIYEADHDYPEAIAMRKHAVDANPDDPSLLMDLGVTQGKAGAFQAAVESLEEAIQGNPRDLRPYFWLGIALQQLGKNAEARAAYQHFVDLAPSRYQRQVAVARQHLDQLPQ